MTSQTPHRTLARLVGLWFWSVAELFEEFFADADLNPRVSAITGVVCGVRVEEIEDPLMQNIRYLDKLIDELAKGKAMPKILREA